MKHDIEMEKLKPGSIQVVLDIITIIFLHYSVLRQRRTAFVFIV